MEFRKKQIDKLLQQLEYDKNTAKMRYETDNRKGATLEKVEYGLSGVVMVTGLSTISAIEFPPAGIAMGIISGLCGIANIIVKTFYKKNKIKTRKWRDICKLIDDTHSQLNRLMSGALEDDRISDNEFNDFNNIFDTYRERLTILRNEYLTLEKSVEVNK